MVGLIWPDRDPFLMNDDLTEWLLQGDPVLRYLVRHNLMPGPDDVDKAGALAYPPLRSLVAAVNAPWPPLTSHKSAGHPLHSLVFLSDLGLTEAELGATPVVQHILDSASSEGAFQVPVKIPQHYGGSGLEEEGWALCDAPLLSYVLVRFGHIKEAAVQRSVSHIRSLVRGNGWPCITSPSLGGFRGPGRKDDPCPYANLITLRLLAAAGLAGSSEANMGVETALQLWSQSRERHPYQFYMGTDFRKLKAPLIWYDILHLADVLSQFPSARRDGRFQDIMEVIVNQADGGGRYTPGSIWTSWKEWDLGQKKEPSRWLTYYVERVRTRVGD